jgi:DNA polymerase-3 subunit delta'
MSWNLIGHEWAEKLLKEHILHQEVRHAYLFTGASGTGRRSLALEFACAVNCLEPPAPGEFCGKCRMCTQLQKMQQADLAIVKAETEGGMIKVEQVRSLERSLSLSPYEAKYRITLLLDFQQANANAQNALLKTLEEAPRQVILLLTADSAENLLPTIASRCEILRLRPTSTRNLGDSLQKRWNLDADSADLYAHLANGRVGTALRFKTQPELLDNRKALLDDLYRLLFSSKRDRFAYTETLARNRDGVRTAMQTWYSYVRDLLMLVNGSSEEITNLDRKAELSGIAEKMSSTDVLKMVGAVDRASSALEVNGHLRLLLDTFFLDLPQIN